MTDITDPRVEAVMKAIQGHDGSSWIVMDRSYAETLLAAADAVDPKRKDERPEARLSANLMGREWFSGTQFDADNVARWILTSPEVKEILEGE